MLPREEKSCRTEAKSGAGTGLYYYGARYYDPAISIFLSVDPLAEKTMTPYQYVYQNPVKYIDPTGMEGENWVKNLETNKYEWKSEVTKPENTPEGYKYVGANDTDILRDLGWDNVGTEYSTKKIGLLPADAGTGYGVSHSSSVELKTTLVAYPNVKTTFGKEGMNKEFIGVDVVINNLSRNSNPDVKASGYGSFNLEGKKYGIPVLPDTSRDRISGGGWEFTTGRATVPASVFSNNSKSILFPNITIEGGWHAFMNNGRDFTTLNKLGPIPIPQTYTYKFTGGYIKR